MAPQEWVLLKSYSIVNKIARQTNNERVLASISVNRIRFVGNFVSQNSSVKRPYFQLFLDDKKIFITDEFGFDYFYTNGISAELKTYTLRQTNGKTIGVRQSFDYVPNPNQQFIGLGFNFTRIKEIDALTGSTPVKLYEFFNSDQSLLITDKEGYEIFFPQPITNYKCVEQGCVEDPMGLYTSLVECENNCQTTTTTTEPVTTTTTTGPVTTTTTTGPVTTTTTTTI